MGVTSLGKTAGKVVVREAGYVAGATAIKGWAGLIRGCSSSIGKSASRELKNASPQELDEIQAEFYAQLQGMSKRDYHDQMRRWQIQSRIFYAGSLLFLSIGAYFLLTNPGWTGLNTTALAAYIFARGLRSSYRYWQMQTRTFFVEGAFTDWFKKGIWLV